MQKWLANGFFLKKGKIYLDLCCINYTDKNVELLISIWRLLEMIIRNWNYATHYIHRTYWCSNIYIAWNLSFCILWCSNRRVICLLVISKYWTILFFRSQIILGNSLHFWFLGEKFFEFIAKKREKCEKILKDIFTLNAFK